MSAAPALPLLSPAGRLPAPSDLAGLSIDAGAWDDLSRRAATPNPFHGRRVVAAHLAHDLSGGALAFVSGRADGRLLALLPLTDRRLFQARGLRAFVSPYAPDGTPLLDAADPEAAADALLAALARHRPGAVWRFPLLALDSVAGTALRAAARRRGLAQMAIESFDRPVLERAGSYADYAARALSENRRKGLRRREKRLADLGPLGQESATGGPGLMQALDAFLALEAAGWKGRRGTSFASRAATGAFARELYRDGDGATAVRADTLTLSGRPIAVSLSLLSGRCCCLHKIAFDESFRALSPGLVLENAILRRFHDEAFADRLDSLGKPGDVLEDLLAGRERIGDWLIGADGIGDGALARLAALERSRAALLRGLKRLRDVAAR